MSVLKRDLLDSNHYVFMVFPVSLMWVATNLTNSSFLSLLRYLTLFSCSHFFSAGAVAF